MSVSSFKSRLTTFRTVRSDCPLIPTYTLAIDSFESLELTRKIYDLGQSIGKPVHFVLNKVNNQNLSTMQKLVCDPDKILAVLPSDPEISESGLLGQELTMENTPIQHLAAALLKRSSYGGAENNA